MNWALALGLASTAMMWALIAINALNLWQGRRLNRETAELTAFVRAEAERIIVLDNVLRALCVQAAGNASDQTWKAWCGTMGTISVHIEGRMGPRPWTTDYSLPTGAEDVLGFLREHGADDA